MDLKDFNNLNIIELSRFMASAGWDVRIESTKRGWGTTPGISIQFERWDWHDERPGNKVSIHAHTDNYIRFEIIARKTALKAFNAYEEFLDCPVTQMGDGTLIRDPAYLEFKRLKRDGVSQI